MHRPHFGAQHLHAKDVRLLAFDVDFAHVDDAGQAEARAGGRRGDAVLAGAGLGDDARLAHPPREQDLAEHIVDLVRAGVVELVALEIDLRPAELLGQPFGKIERAGTADIMLEERVEFRLERRIGLRRLVGLLERENQRHQRFGDETSAENPEMAALVGAVAERVGLLELGHAGSLSRAAFARAGEARARRGDEGGDAVGVLDARPRLDA